MTHLPFDSHDPVFVAAALRIIGNKVRCHAWLRYRHVDIRERASSDLFASLLLQMPKFDGTRASLETYIEMVVHDDLRDWLKAESRRCLRESRLRQDLDIAVVALSPSSQSHTDARVDIAARLSAEAGTGAQAIAWKLDGHTNADIARCLRRPESSVHAYFRSLRRCLPGYGRE